MGRNGGALARVCRHARRARNEVGAELRFRSAVEALLVIDVEMSRCDRRIGLPLLRAVVERGPVGGSLGKLGDRGLAARSVGAGRYGGEQQQSRGGLQQAEERKL